MSCSTNKVVYWLSKLNIPKRSISEAIYVKNNPKGDPFLLKDFKLSNNSFLMGLGLGLYWGEGTKANKHSVRLGNTDPDLINKFIEFLIKICGVNKNNLRFGLQTFTDIDSDTALNFWINKIKVKKEQFYKITSTKSNSIGTYKNKSVYGVLTVYYNNKKLRDILLDMLPR